MEDQRLSWEGLFDLSKPQTVRHAAQGGTNYVAKRRLRAASRATAMMMIEPMIACCQ